MKMMLLRTGFSYSEKYFVGHPDHVLAIFHAAFNLTEVDRNSDGSFQPAKVPEWLVHSIEVVNVQEDAAGAMSALQNILALEDDVGQPKTRAGLIAAAAIKKAVGERIAAAAGMGPPPDADDLIPF